MNVVRVRARLLREERGRPATLRDARVLVYWPHGLGDFVQLGYALPLLEPRNVWAFTRVGDDFVAVLDETPYARALHTGTLAPLDGAWSRSRRGFDGRRHEIGVGAPLAGLVAAFAPDAIVWPEFHDRGGGAAFPFHTKARAFARAMVAPARLRMFDLDRPLPSGLVLDAPPHVQARVDARLRQLVPRGERLCIIVRGGYSDPLKTWGHGWREELPPGQRDEGAEVRAFAGALAARGWRMLTFEDATFGSGTHAWPGADRVAAWDAFTAGRFDGIPFAMLLKAVLRRASLVAGVPAGPFHLALARRDVPVVGVWLHQHPDWYDEPSMAARHLIGADVVRRGWDRRRASRTRPATWSHTIATLATSYAPADAVLAEAEALVTI